jgi:zinc protease
LAIGLTVEDIGAWPQVLDSVTKEDVMAAAKMVFDRDKAVTGWLMREEAAQ